MDFTIANGNYQGPILLNFNYSLMNLHMTHCIDMKMIAPFYKL